MASVETIDDMQFFFERLERGDRFREFCTHERTVILSSRRDTGFGIESLILHEENYALGGALLRSLRHTGHHWPRHGRSRETLEYASASESLFDHDTKKRLCAWPSAWPSLLSHDLQDAPYRVAPI